VRKWYCFIHRWSKEFWWPAPKNFSLCQYEGDSSKKGPYLSEIVGQWA